MTVFRVNYIALISQNLVAGSFRIIIISEMLQVIIDIAISIIIMDSVIGKLVLKALPVY